MIENHCDGSSSPDEATPEVEYQDLPRMGIPS